MNPQCVWKMCWKWPWHPEGHLVSVIDGCCFSHTVTHTHTNYLSAPLSHITIHSFSLEALFDTKDLFTLMCTNANFVLRNCTQHTSLFPVHILKYAFLPFSSLFSPPWKMWSLWAECDPSTHLSGPRTTQSEILKCSSEGCKCEMSVPALCLRDVIWYADTYVCIQGRLRLFTAKTLHNSCT